MAVVRVKRRLDDDPVNSLVLLCKKVKTNTETDCASVSYTESTEPVRSIFKFAGTVTGQDKDKSISHCISQKSRAEWRWRQNRKPSDHSAHKHKVVASNARYKIVSDRRAVASEDLHETQLDDEIQQHSVGSCVHIYDIEKLDDVSNFAPISNTQQSSSVITCNDIPMVRESVPLPGKPSRSPAKANLSEITDDDDDFVFDVYRTEDDQFDFHSLENVLAIHAFSENDPELWYGGESSEDEAGYDEDDENAENNWRNDYPDDDPMYFERLHLDDLDDYSSGDDAGRWYGRDDTDDEC